jgi:hypothetical protein
MRGALRRGRYAHARYERAASGGTLSYHLYTIRAHRLSTMFVQHLTALRAWSRQEHAIDALRAC